MRDEGQRSIALAQVDWFNSFANNDQPEFASDVSHARTPDDVRMAWLKERPVLDAWRELAGDGPHPDELRREAMAAGALRTDDHDLAFRRLFPGLDLGIYAANHAMGKPSLALAPALDEHLARLAVHGIESWGPGGWLEVVDRFRDHVAALVGGDLIAGDVVHYANLSEALSAALAGCTGRMVSEEGHFTTARYVHRLWAQRTGSALVEVVSERHGGTSTDALIDALTPDTTVVSVSHAAWRTGQLVDVAALGAAVREICPEALYIVDVYQTLGTVPFTVDRLPERSVVCGGGIKQLHAGTGAGFAWLSHAALDRMPADRTGWWAHRDPIAFEDSFEPASGAARLRTGTPPLAPMVALVTEVDVFASSGDGQVAAAVRRAREVTSEAVRAAIADARAYGLSVVGPDDPADRAAFFAVIVDDGPALVDRLGDRGVFVDFRAFQRAGTRGLVRLSSSAASFPYELRYAVEAIANELGRR